MKVVLDDDRPNGLASMLARLIDANLERHPARHGLLRPSVIELLVPDAEVSATIRLSPEVVRVSNGLAPDERHVSVVASSHDLLLLASIPLRAGFPDPLTAGGRAVLRRVVRRRVRIGGLLRHPGRLSRLARLLSVA